MILILVNIVVEVKDIFIKINIMPIFNIYYYAKSLTNTRQVAVLHMMISNGQCSYRLGCESTSDMYIKWI